MWNRVELKEDSKGLLRLNYWPFVLVALIHALVTESIGSRINLHNSSEGFGFDFGSHGRYDVYRSFERWGNLLLTILGAAMIAAVGITVVVLVLDIFVLNPIEVGCKRYMTIAREVKPEFGEMGFAFRNCYGNIVKTMFLRQLYTFLWSLLFVIPGIVKTYEYRMIPYLMAEYPDMACEEAFRISKEMMMGNKWEAFVLDLSFLGWNLLSSITFGILGLFYVSPYQMLTNAALYLALKKTNPSLGYVQPDDQYYYNGGRF